VNKLKKWMMGVVIHEVVITFSNDCESDVNGHGWMKVKLFYGIHGRGELGTNFPSRRGPANIVI
jgi:hypothetical protein